MKQLYRVSFQRKDDLVKEARLQYVQAIVTGLEQMGLNSRPALLLQAAVSADLKSPARISKDVCSSPETARTQSLKEANVKCTVMKLWRDSRWATVSK
ncbi:hypothetical protein SKAU_G00148540 [Synaphobranchus kaupii]|uniref:Uncharacterized protein n=1 Tax=Synaphobranchus kaupii TaxID=118154 RepID=A0A9Q1FUQ4_SYNKA|nr:hypothetical protein SKAU_G00148540 [Synaphobranchus kaupii]